MRWYASEQDVVDHLVFSGADTYGWYYQLAVDGDLNVTIGIADPDVEDTAVFITMSAMNLRSLAEQGVMGGKPGAHHVARAIAEDDFDSTDADIVLQWAVFGTLVYG